MKFIQLLRINSLNPIKIKCYEKQEPRQWQKIK